MRRNSMKAGSICVVVVLVTVVLSLVVLKSMHRMTVFMDITETKFASVRSQHCINAFVQYAISWCNAQSETVRSMAEETSIFMQLGPVYIDGQEYTADIALKKNKPMCAINVALFHNKKRSMERSVVLALGTGSSREKLTVVQWH